MIAGGRSISAFICLDLFRCSDWRTGGKALSWTGKPTFPQPQAGKAERRTDAFDRWCWRRLLRGPWTARRSNQSILKEISPEYSLEWLMLKLQFFGYLMQRTDLLPKTLMLGRNEGGRNRGQQRMRWLDGIIHSMDMSLSKFRSWWWTGSLACFCSWGRKESYLTEWLNWTDWNQPSGDFLWASSWCFNAPTIVSPSGMELEWPWISQRCSASHCRLNDSRSVLPLS